MTNEAVSAGDLRPTRLRALYDRIERLPPQDLHEIEQAVTRTEMRTRLVDSGTTRTVLGATITDRPDLAYAAQVAGAPVVDHQPASEHAAELAKVGGHAR